MVEQIAINELGHAVVGLFSKHHSKMTKIVINLSSPKSPAYTIFEASTSGIANRESLFEHLMILLAGRIAEEAFYGIGSVSTGALGDFEEALKLAGKMVCVYGMGNKIIYPTTSDKYKELVDVEVANLIQQAYVQASIIVQNTKELIKEGAALLQKDDILLAATLIDMMNAKYKGMLPIPIAEN